MSDDFPANNVVDLDRYRKPPGSKPASLPEHEASGPGNEVSTLFYLKPANQKNPHDSIWGDFVLALADRMLECAQQIATNNGTQSQLIAVDASKENPAKLVLRLKSTLVESDPFVWEMLEFNKEFQHFSDMAKRDGRTEREVGAVKPLQISEPKNGEFTLTITAADGRFSSVIKSLKPLFNAYAIELRYPAKLMLEEQVARQNYIHLP